MKLDRIRRGTVLFFAAFALVTFGGTASAYASNVVPSYPTPPPSSNNAAPGIYPIKANHDGYFEFSLSPGQSATAEIQISNQSKSTETFLIYGAAGITSNVTGVAYTQPLAGGVASWLSTKPHLVTLTSGQKEVEVVTIHVPKGTKPGDYVGALVGQGPPSSQKVNTTKKQTSGALIVTSRSIVAIVASVPGPRTTTMVIGKPTLQAQNGIRQVINVPMKEVGNRLTHPSIDLVVSSCASPHRSVFIYKQQLDTFVPFTSIQYPVYLNQTVLPAGCYHVGGTVASNGNNYALHGTIHVTSAQTKVTPSRLSTVSIAQSLFTQVNLFKKLALIMAGVTILLILGFIFLIFKRKHKNAEMKKLSNLNISSMEFPDL